MKPSLNLLLIILCFSSVAQKIKPFYGPFPEPAPNKNMLFYLQRTVDRNTLIYELNYEPGGELNGKNPVKVYWIDFEDGAKISPLTFIQSKFAYGINSELIDKEKGTYQIHLVSYKKIKFDLIPSGKNQHYQVHVLIKDKPAILNRIFINILGGTYMNPIVSYIELTGDELKTGTRITERIKPD